MQLQVFNRPAHDAELSRHYTDILCFFYHKKRKLGFILDSKKKMKIFKFRILNHILFWIFIFFLLYNTALCSLWFHYQGLCKPYLSAT